MEIELLDFITVWLEYFISFLIILNTEVQGK